MALQRSVMTAVLFGWILTVLAYPQAKNLRGARRPYPRTLSGILQQISLPTNSTTTPQQPPAPIGAITCFQRIPGHPPTDVDRCRPTLNYFRTFPNYRRIQGFLEGRHPKMPSKPPYAVHHKLSNCAVQIASRDPSILDDFSFEQARALATEILEVCLNYGGHGGTAPIGHRIGWGVSVIGFTLPPDPPDGTSLLEESSRGNETSVPVEVVDI